MTVSRASQVDPSTTPYYHVMSRCVRRAFLCGLDRYWGRDYEHREGWLVQRLRALGSMFAVEVCAYAVMSNHYHLVLRLTPEKAAAWGEDEVVERYSKLFSNAKAQLAALKQLLGVQIELGASPMPAGAVLVELSYQVSAWSVDQLQRDEQLF